MSFSGAPILLIILVTSLYGRSFCCEHDKFILDYAELYSLSQVAIIVKAEENNQVKPTSHISAAYISYDNSEVGRVVEYIASVRDEIEALFFIGTDHSDLIHRMDNDTDVFHSEILSVINYHPTVDFRLRLDTNILICHQEGTSYTLTEDFAIKGGPKISMDVGTWSKELGLSVSHPLLWERRSDLKNVKIINTILPWPSHNDYTYDNNGEILLLGGLYQDIVSNLEARLNFSTRTITPPDKKWGSVLPNGSWTGMIRQLEYGEADMCSAGLTRSFERDDRVSFGITTRVYSHTLVQPSDTTLAINVWVYLIIFPPLAWAVILALLLSVGMFLLVIAKCYKDSSHSGNITFIDSLSITFLYLIQLSDDRVKLFRTKALKVGLVTWAIGCYLIFAYYTASLIADMTTGPPESKIR